MRGVKLEEEGAVAAQGGWPRGAGARGGAVAKVRGERSECHYRLGGQDVLRGHGRCE